MEFTYDLTTAVGKVRLEIGDTSSDDGVKPDGSNLTDAEISLWLTEEGSVGRASARACEALARTWARLVDLAVGPRRESLSQAAKAWAEQGAELRRQHGGGKMGAYAAGWLRQDGYGDEAEPSDERGESEASASEYGRETVYIRV
jgi:hypothetical protein